MTERKPTTAKSSAAPSERGRAVAKPRGFTDRSSPGTTGHRFGSYSLKAPRGYAPRPAAMAGASTLKPTAATTSTTPIQRFEWSRGSRRAAMGASGATALAGGGLLAGSLGYLGAGAAGLLAAPALPYIGGALLAGGVIGGVASYLTGSTPKRGTMKETIAPKSLKPDEQADAMQAFLGPPPYSNHHPRTGETDPNRLVSADGKRSIRYGNHETTGKHTKHHFHEETWIHDTDNDVMHVNNLVRRVPILNKGDHAGHVAHHKNILSKRSFK